jgi:hypothetical protein
MAVSRVLKRQGFRHPPSGDRLPRQTVTTAELVHDQLNVPQVANG